MTYTGPKIKAARKSAGISQAELAERIGVPYQSIGQWERNERNPKIETLQRIADALSIPVYQLFGPEPNEISNNLKRIRLGRGLTQKELGDLLGVSQATVGQYETNQNPPKLETLQRIADALSISVTDILDPAHPKKPFVNAESLDYITHKLTPGDRLCQLAEEAAELGKAALKTKRALEGTNPTPVTLAEALDNLQEELEDILVCVEALAPDILLVPDVSPSKIDRWARRLGTAVNPQRE